MEIRMVDIGEAENVFVEVDPKPVLVFLSHEDQEPFCVPVDLEKIVATQLQRVDFLSFPYRLHSEGHDVDATEFIGGLAIRLPVRILPLGINGDCRLDTCDGSD